MFAACCRLLARRRAGNMMFVASALIGTMDAVILEWRDPDDSEQLTPLMAAVLGGR